MSPSQELTHQHQLKRSFHVSKTMRESEEKLSDKSDHRRLSDVTSDIWNSGITLRSSAVVLLGHLDRPCSVQGCTCSGGTCHILKSRNHLHMLQNMFLSYCGHLSPPPALPPTPQQCVPSGCVPSTVEICLLRMTVSFGHTCSQTRCTFNGKSFQISSHLGLILLFFTIVGLCHLC